MRRNKIYAIVEGHGEADTAKSGRRPAVTILVARILQSLGSPGIYPNEKHPPFRMSYGEFFRGDKLERAIRYHAKYADCAALLILLDMDDECPAQKAADLVTRVHSLGDLGFSVAIVCAKREYESWFLASLESIHRGETYSGDPEAIRDAKGYLRKRYGYKPTIHQAQYTEVMDISITGERSRSFRRMQHAIAEILEAWNNGINTVTPLLVSR